MRFIQKISTMEKLYTVEGWSNLIHLCTARKEAPICGTHINYPNRGREVRVSNEEIQQKWGDGEIQEIKWVKTNRHEYCKKCIGILFKNPA